MSRVVKRSASQTVKPGRSRRDVPLPQFVPPQLSKLVENPPSGAQWLHEIKLDGYRMAARKDAGRVVHWSRYATDYSDTFLRIAEAVRALPVDHMMIDGEALVFRPDGHSDFTAL
jgi:bifunctional non-homologous end joining protein LigD